VQGRVYVARNASGLKEIEPGDEILGMDGTSAAGWLARTERHVSAETPYMAHSLMEYDFPIYVWVELGEVDGFDLDIRKPDGTTRHLRLPARTTAEMTAFAAAQPAALNLEEPLRESRMLDGGVGYLRPGPFYNAEAKTGAEEWDNSAYKTFLDEAFAKFGAAHARRPLPSHRSDGIIACTDAHHAPAVQSPSLRCADGDLHTARFLRVAHRRHRAHGFHRDLVIGITRMHQRLAYGFDTLLGEIEIGLGATFRVGITEHGDVRLRDLLGLHCCCLNDLPVAGIQVRGPGLEEHQEQAGALVRRLRSRG
jgi:hypothetical protein